MLMQPMSASNGFPVSSQILQSFASPPAFYRIGGPGRLLRLVQLAKITRTGEVQKQSKFAGDCWFDERLYQRLRADALAQLAEQNGDGKRLMDNVPRTDLVGLHMRFPLRDLLAVSSNWNEFNAYVSFSFGPKESLVALVGKTKAQDYYSVEDPRHETAKRADVGLLGGEDQFIIDFTFPANERFKNRILGPTLF